MGLLRRFRKWRSMGLLRIRRFRKWRSMGLLRRFWKCWWWLNGEMDNRRIRTNIDGWIQWKLG
jgi:hypothetical protein